MEADTSVFQEGLASVYVLFSPVNAWENCYLETSAFMAIAPANDYELSCYYIGVGVELNTCYAEVRCYDAVPNYLGSIYCNFNTSVFDWTKKIWIIDSGQWPVGTTQCKIRWYWGQGFHTLLAFHLDNSRLVALPAGYNSFWGQVGVEGLQGVVLVIPHMKLTTAQTLKDTNLSALVSDSVYGDLADWTILESKELDFGNVWLYYINNHFKPIKIPSHGISEYADLTTLVQKIRLEMDETIPDTVDMWVDCFGFIPVDLGFVDIPSGGYEHLIINGMSEIPKILTSWDGTLDTAMALPFTSGAGNVWFRLDPQNGSNLAMLVDCPNTGFFFPADVAVQYRPQFLVVD